MPCKGKLKPFTVHPIGIILICIGCAIVAMVHNKALMEGAEKQAEEDEKKKQEEGEAPPPAAEAEPAPEEEEEAPAEEAGEEEAEA